MRSNGGIIGAKKTVSTSSASGIWAIRDAQRETGANNWPALGDFHSISTITVGSGGTGSITFSSIPSTYSHLQIRLIAQTNRSTADNADDMYVRFNSDSTDNYPFHRLRGSGTSVDTAGAATGTGFTGILLPTAAGITSNANNYGTSIIDIYDYANSNKYKTLKTLCGTDANASPSFITFASGFWRNTSAITSITIIPGIGNTFSQYSHFALYGIKG